MTATNNEEYMELTTGATSERPEEPIVFDITQLNEVLRQSLGLAFLGGKATFGEGKELYDSVAKSGGIDDKTGELDMEFLQTVEKGIAYLKGRQGQPVVVAKVRRKGDSAIVRLDAYAGVLADTPELLTGVAPFGELAIITAGAPFEISAHTRLRTDGRLALERTASTEAPRIMFNKSHFHIGDDDYDISREMVAGADIIPWIKREFGASDEGYEIFRGLLIAFRHSEAIHYLEDDEFLAMLSRDTAFHIGARRVLTELSETLDGYDAAKENAKQETMRALVGSVKSLLGETLAYRVPYGKGGTSWYHGRITAPFEDDAAPEIAARLEGIDYSLGRLDPGLLDFRGHL